MIQTETNESDDTHLRNNYARCSGSVLFLSGKGSAGSIFQFSRYFSAILLITTLLRCSRFVRYFFSPPGIQISLVTEKSTNLFIVISFFRLIQSNLLPFLFIHSYLFVSNQFLCHSEELAIDIVSFFFHSIFPHFFPLFPFPS